MHYRAQRNQQNRCHQRGESEGPGQVQGRKPSVPTAEIRKLKAEGMGVTAIADRLGILQDIGPWKHPDYSAIFFLTRSTLRGCPYMIRTATFLPL
jgi:hypothetical protein